MASLTLTVDARALNVAGAGTQVHILELLTALHATPRLRLRVVLPPDPSATAVAALSALVGVETWRYHDIVNAGLPLDDVVHRPYQVYTSHDLRLLERLGKAIVITHQDQLLYRQASYFSTDQASTWHDYRRATREALQRADRVVYFTEHARREALADGLGTARRTAVVRIGVDHAVAARLGPARPPRGLQVLGDRPYLLQLGTDLAHKQRPFSIALLRELRARHGWDGGLVLAGPRAAAGSTRDDEDRMLEERTEPVARIDRVDDTERAWLLSHAAAVSFPSRDEGFGLVPFEAAMSGVPCLYAGVGALAELLPSAHAALVPWDAAASAGAARCLLEPGPERNAHVSALRAAGRTLTWDAAARELAPVYRAAVRARRWRRASRWVRARA